MDKDEKKAATKAANKATREARKRAAAAARKNRVGAGEYFRGVKTEIKKVVWPTKKEMGSFTVVVVLACTFFAVLFAVVDYSFLAALKAVLGISLG